MTYLYQCFGEAVVLVIVVVKTKVFKQALLFKAYVRQNLFFDAAHTLADGKQQAVAQG